MAINNAKHIVSEIDGVRCTIVESSVPLERVAFLKELLEFNNYDVRKQVIHPESEGGETLYTVGVTDLVFNPVFAIYERLLKTLEGEHVTPGYWNQKCINCDPMYWMRRKA
jgi:hypothetical protein